MKRSVLKDMWIAFRTDDRPHWEVMADDGMNKFLKIVIFSFEKLSTYSKRFSQSSKLKKVLSSFTNLIPFHSMGLWLAVIITPPIASVV